MITNFEDLIPSHKILLSIKDLDQYGIIKSSMCKKLIYKGELETIKIGSKNHFSRAEIIRYLKSRTIPAVNAIELIKKSA